MEKQAMFDMLDDFTIGHLERWLHHRFIGQQDIDRARRDILNTIGQEPWMLDNDHNWSWPEILEASKKVL